MIFVGLGNEGDGGGAYLVGALLFGLALWCGRLFEKVAKR